MTCTRWKAAPRKWGTQSDMDKFYAAVDRAAYVQYLRVQAEARRRLERQACGTQLRLADI